MLHTDPSVREGATGVAVLLVAALADAEVGRERLPHDLVSDGAHHVMSALHPW